MDKKTQKKVEKIAKEFFKKTSFETAVEVRPGQEENCLAISVKTDEPQILIGERGRTLSEMQMLLGRIIRKQTQNELYLNLDINQYKENKTRYLKELANEAADQAALEKKERELQPMSSFERRVIHLELSERGDVKTESRGDDPLRRVVIKPA